MAQKSLNQQFPIDRNTKIDDVWLRRLLGVLESRLSGIEGKAADFDEAVALLLSVGIDRINEVLIPAIEQVRDLTQLGFLIANSQTSALLVENATTVFTVPPGAQRDLFTPSPFVILTRDVNLDDWAIMRTVSYSQESGEFVGTMVAVHGGPGPFSDWTLGALAGSTVAQMDMLDESILLRDQAADDAATATAAAGVAVTKAEEVLDNAEEVEQDRAEVAAKKAEFDRVYWGRRATPPPTTGDGAAQPGAIYVDTSVTPNVVKVLGAGNTWAPAVTVSIGGARQQIYIATEGQTGPFSVDGGFTTGSVNVNGAELYHGHGVTLTPGPAGTFTLDTPRKAGDLIVFSGYLANDATDIFTKSETDARFVRKDGAQALTEAEKGRARANIGGGVLAGIRNKIINGDFDIWQRGTSQTLSGYGSVDRWSSAHTGSTKTLSRQAFALGQTAVPGNPKFFARTVVASVAGAANRALNFQYIEDVSTLSGKEATLTFYAKADSNKNMAVELSQFFGTGGSPSADVQGIGAQLVALTPAWQKFSLKIAIPSVAGKTIGSSGGDALGVSFWFDAGANHAARAAGLGQQSGTFDIAHVSLVEGDATAEEDPFSPRHPQQELALCQRYYERIQTTAGLTPPDIGFSLYNFGGSFLGLWVFKSRKRGIPTLSWSAWTSGSAPNTNSAGIDSARFQSGSSVVYISNGDWIAADAEL